jgi:hypothetical protein
VLASRSAAAIVAAAATVVALVSSWHSGRHMWHRLDSDYRIYSAYTPTERRHAPLAWVQLDGNIFDWYARYLDRGDRVYYQVSPVDEPRVVKMAASYYLLPSMEVTDVTKATAVVSYMADPGFLQIRFLTQQRAGLQPIFVSRIRAP